MGCVTLNDTTEATYEGLRTCMNQVPYIDFIQKMDMIEFSNRYQIDLIKVIYIHQVDKELLLLHQSVCLTTDYFSNLFAL